MNQKRRYFNELAPRWDTLPSPPDAADKVRRFVERALTPDARLVLDIGGGTGILLPALLERCGAAARLLELDLAEGMLAESARKFADQRVARLCADARRLPLRAASFDLVLCFGVLPHLGEVGEALRGLMHVLRAGGVLAVGHLMGSRELNTFHASLDAAVASDRLPSAEALTEILRGLGAAEIIAEEGSDWYFVRAEKRFS
jgi:malonyl-CoA O-methyltransferase